MGPRPEDRGEEFGGWAIPDPGVCFNGATARRPWRVRGASDSHALLDSFNGATARRPWRGGSLSFLQTSPYCFNGATARRPWRAQPPPLGGLRTTGLQWGHGPKTVESIGGPIAPPPRGTASMGPRPEDRGETPTSSGPGTRSRGFNGATARRPWRGAASGDTLARPTPLQWGHGPKTVER